MSLADVVKGPVSQGFGHFRVLPDGGNAIPAEPTAWIEYDGAHNPAGAKRAKFSQFAGASLFDNVHMGVDVIAPIGTPVRAPADGTCVLHSVYQTYFGGKKVLGYAVLFQFGTKILYVDHLSGYVAKVGQKVPNGGVIARTGNTGASFGPHAHIEVWQSWQNFATSTRLNPQRVFG